MNRYSGTTPFARKDRRRSHAGTLLAARAGVCAFERACLADIELKDDLLKKLKAITDPGKITFQDGTQHEVSVPLSFKGFSEALEAMVKE